MSEHQPVSPETGADLLRRYGLDRLSADERIALAEELFESVTREYESAPLSPAQSAELDRRLARRRDHPDDYTPWEVVKAEGRARMRAEG